MKKAFLILLCLAATLHGQEGNPSKRLANAVDTFTELMRTPDKGIPKELFDKAKCVVIVPGLKKGAFGVGGKYGRGFAACRKTTGWSGPAAIAIEGGSFGFQLGAAATDVVMLIMNQNGMNRLLGDKFTIGGEASAAIGPVGRQRAPIRTFC
jgi:lipid-binding SYLF domain-containing protein